MQFVKGRKKQKKTHREILVKIKIKKVPFKPYLFFFFLPVYICNSLFFVCCCCLFRLVINTIKQRCWIELKGNRKKKKTGTKTVVRTSECRDFCSTVLPLCQHARNGSSIEGQDGKTRIWKKKKTAREHKWTRDEEEPPCVSNSRFHLFQRHPSQRRLFWNSSGSTDFLNNVNGGKQQKTPFTSLLKLQKKKKRW